MINLVRWERNPWSIFDELESLQEDFDRTFNGSGRPWRGGRRAFPPMNVWSSAEGVVIDAELPGADPADVDISVQGDELTLRGKVNAAEPGKDETCHRRERSTGEFTRSLQLPFRADPGGVKANYKNGILRIRVPRSEEEKPRKVVIEAA